MNGTPLLVRRADKIAAKWFCSLRQRGGSASGRRRECVEADRLKSAAGRRHASACTPSCRRPATCGLTRSAIMSWSYARLTVGAGLDAPQIGVRTTLALHARKSHTCARLQNLPLRISL
eukprot:1805315-Pleurochrysis_carterae.AAC.1